MSKQKRVTALKLFAKWRINQNDFFPVKMMKWCFRSSTQQNITNDTSFTSQSWCSVSCKHSLTLLLRGKSAVRNRAWTGMLSGFPSQDKTEVILPTPCNF